MNSVLNKCFSFSCFIRVGSLVILCLLFFSCTTQNKCLRKYPPEIKTIVKDSIVTKIVYVDTVIYVTLYDTIIKEIKAQEKPLKTILGIIRTDTSIIENEFSISKSWVNQKLFHELILKGQVRAVSGEWATEIRNYYKEYYKTTSETKIIKVKYYPKWLIILACIGGSFIIFVGVWIFFKIKGGWLSDIPRMLR